jgi:hypothetical protein
MSFKEKVEKLFIYLPPSLDSVKGELYENGKKIGLKTGYEPYIQHIPEVIEEAQQVFIDLCVQEKILDDSFLKGKVHRQGIIGRYLDDSGSGAYKYWNRFMCIDEKYREWEQPYYAINAEKEDMGLYFEGVCINNLSPELITFFRDQKIKKVLS